jgi:DNA-binding LytR/AlgR family response regulator
MTLPHSFPSAFDTTTRPEGGGAARILVVDDEPLFAEQVEALLTDMGHEAVGPATNAQIALALHRTENIDLVLLDIALRGSTNGIKLAELLLAHNPVPIIFLTSFADNETFQQAQQVGPVAYLTKPIEPNSLRRAITLAVRNFTAAQWPSQTSHPTASPAPAPALPVLPAVIFVKEHGLLERVGLSEIYSVMADHKLCTLTLAERSISVRMSLRELAQYLPAEHFVQIQRSYFVNMEHVVRLDPARHLVQVGKQLLPVGRLYLLDFMARLRTLS